MKNEFKIFIASLFIASLSFGQNQVNTLPSTGKVGIGTATPTVELSVKGKTELDGYTVVKDCVKIEKRLTVDQDVKIIGKTVMVDNVRAKSNLTILGNTKTKGNEIVEGNTKILGTTQMMGNGFVEGTFKFKGLADNTTTENRFLMIKPNGKAESFEKAGLLNLLYSEPCQIFVDINGNPGLYPSPTWASIAGPDHGIIYTGVPCSAWLGLGTDSPIAHLDIRGNGYFSGRVGIGQNFDADNKLSILETNPLKNGLVVSLTNSNSSILDGVGIKTIVNNPLRSAFVITNGSSQDVFNILGSGVMNIREQQSIAKSFFITDNTNQDVFRVMGDGNVYATEVNVRIKQDFPDYVFSNDYNLMSLKSLEAYIKENKHLPSVPSAKEVKENGMNVSEILVTQMEKIEELTLYIIELEKRLSELEK